MPPVISAVVITAVSPTSIVASWTTDIPADSNAYAGTKGAVDNGIAASSTSHLCVIAGLIPNKTYSCYVQSGGVNSTPQNVTTLAAVQRKPLTGPPVNTNALGAVTVLNPPLGGDTMVSFVSSDNVAYTSQDDGRGIDTTSNAGANLQVDKYTDEVNFAGPFVNLLTGYGGFATTNGTDGPTGLALTNKANGIFGMKGRLFMPVSRNLNNNGSFPTAPAYFGNIIGDNGDHGATWNNKSALSTFLAAGNPIGTGSAGTQFGNDNYGWLSFVRYGVDDGTLGYSVPGNCIDDANAYVYLYFMDTGQVTNDVYLLRIPRIQLDLTNGATGYQFWIGPASPTPSDFVNDANWSSSATGKRSIYHTTAYTYGWFIAQFIPTLNIYLASTLIQEPPYGGSGNKDQFCLSGPTPAGPWTPFFFQGSRLNLYSALVPFHRDLTSNVATNAIPLRCHITKGNGYRCAQVTFTVQTDANQSMLAFQPWSQSANQSPMALAAWTNYNTTVWGTPLQISSKQVCVTALSKNAGSIYTGISWPRDHYSEIVIGTIVNPSSSPGLIVRGDANGNCYLVSFNNLAGQSFVYKITGNGTVSTQLGGAFSTGGLAEDDVFKVTATGAGTVTFKIYKNGSLLATYTDSTATLDNGSPGIRDFQSAGPTPDIQSWSGGGVQTLQPTISPAGGSYPSTQLITLATGTAGASIYYTTDGSTPTTSSNLYSAPFMLGNATVIKAFATNTSPIVFADSTVAIGVFEAPASSGTGVLGADPDALFQAVGAVTTLTASLQIALDGITWVDFVAAANFISNTSTLKAVTPIVAGPRYRIHATVVTGFIDFWIAVNGNVFKLNNAAITAPTDIPFSISPGGRIR